MITIRKVDSVRKKEYLYIKKALRRRMRIATKLYKIVHGECPIGEEREQIRGAHEQLVKNFNMVLKDYNDSYRKGKKEYEKKRISIH